MKPLIVYNSKYLRFVNRWAAGQTLYPVLLFKWTREEVARSHIFRHELQHFYQGQKYGWFKFFFYYLRSFFRHGYKEHPMEKGAENHEREPLTEEEKAWRDGPESKVAKFVDLFMAMWIPAMLAFSAYSFYRWTQGG